MITTGISKSPLSTRQPNRYQQPSNKPCNGDAVALSCQTTVRYANGAGATATYTKAVRKSDHLGDVRYDSKQLKHSCHSAIHQALYSFHAGDRK